MKISFNPSNSNKNILDLIKNNKDIIFDLKGHSIFARGVEFKGTDTNTWRDIKINNVSIGSHTLDLRNGSNTTLTNTNGVVTINSTWRPVVDNLTSDSTTSSLSAKQGKVLKALIDGKSNSDHNHDGRYVKKSGDTMSGVLTIDTSNSGALTIKRNDDARGASIQFRGKSSVYGYIGLNNSTKDKQFLRWSSDTSRIYTILDTSSTYISNGKGVINGTTITQVANATNSTNSTNARKLVNWYSARPTSLNAQFGDGSLRIFYATSSTTEGKPAEDSHILHLAWDNTGGFDAQLAVHARSGKVSTRAQNGGTWQPWKTLAFANEIPTSLKNPYALTISLNGTSQGPYDGSAAKNINITPGSIGAAVSNHSHDYLVVNSADDKSFNSAYHNFQVLYAGGGNKITGKPANVDAFGLLKFRVASGFSGQMLLANGGSLYIRSSEDAKMTNTLAWKTILDSSNYSGILDSRYYTESEVNSLLNAKLDRQNLSYGTWNPRGYHLAADYHYNGGDLSISESGGKIHVSVNGYFWQNEGQYRVLDTSDIGDIRNRVTLHQYLSATDAAWYPLVWGGDSHNNTSDSTGAVYKSYGKLSWQTSSQTLYATNIQTNNIKSLSIGGGIYWNPYVESASNGSDAASITLVRSGVAGGTTLVLSQMNDTNDTIQFKTNTAARLYHNSYPILTTQNTYVNNNKGYINGLEITQVNNADTLDGAHLSDIKNWSDRTASAYWKAGWYKVASAQTATNIEAFLTLDVNAAQSNGHATLFIRKRADSKPYFICTHNNNLNLADFRLYYNGMSMVLYARVPNDWNGRVFRIISEGREGTYDHIWTLYSNVSSTDPNAISAEGENPYINPTYSGRVDWSNSSDKANYANSAGSVAWNNVTNKPSTFNPAAHTHTVFKNNLMIKGTNGISDSASIHLGIGDSDTGFKWISDGVCQIYANNAAVGQWTSGGMNWFKNPTVNGNKVWNAGNDGSGSGLDADLLDGWHLDSIKKYVGYSWSVKYRINNWSRIIKIDNYSNILLAINFSQNSQASNHLYLISTGYSCGNIVQLGTNGFNSNSAIKIRLTENRATSHNVEIYSTYGYNGATELSINCNYIRIDGNSTITTYLTYTAGGGTVRKEITSSYSKIVANLQGNSDTATKLQTARSIWGQSFDGTADVDNTLRIKQTTGNYCEGIRIQTADSTRATIILGATGDSGTNANAWSIHRKADNNFAISRNSSDGTNGLVMTSVGMGLGTTAPTQRLDVAGNIRATGQIIREGHSNKWVYGRSVALLRETSAVGYHTLWSLKTTNGSWDFGEYNAGSDWNNIPVLSYITDSNYNSGNNATTYQIKFPLASGTVALTSNIPNPTNYYWANVKISASSSTTTSPTVHTLAATRVCAGHNPGIDNSISCSNWFRSSGNTGWYNTTYQGGWYMSDTSWIRAHNGVGIYTSGQIYSSSSIRMSNISLEHTDEINNITNGGIHLNYRNSGNVSLCYGGGNVGIGTTTPSYKLDVNGQMRASGFHHSSVNSDNYILLAGGGYKSFGGDDSTPIFLGCLDLYCGDDGTISSSFHCLGYSVPFTYTRGGNYCKIVIPDTTRLSFYIIAATASVNYSGGGMDTWTGHHRGSGAWWLHCYAFGWNEVRVKGFCQANHNNDSWWGGNPLWNNEQGANRITVCIFGNVKYK